MKHGKNPTVAKAKLMQSKNMNYRKWIVVKDTPNFMEVVHRQSDKTRRVIEK